MSKLRSIAELKALVLYKELKKIIMAQNQNERTEENIRSIYKKQFFEIMSGFFHFLPFQFSKKFTVPKKWKLFFFE